VRERRPLIDARRRARPAWSIFAVLLGVASGCGAEQISIGAAEATEFFIAPAGSDDASGTTPTRAWLTFRKALSRLGPGSTLTLLNGVYEAELHGGLHVDCAADAAHGTAAQPVVVRAADERRAFLRGNGVLPPLMIQNCSYWEVHGLRVEAIDQAGAPGTPEAGSVVVLGTNNHNMRVRRLLVARPNRHVHSHVFRIGDGSSDILVEENELYDFHHNGFEVSRSTGVVFRRNYVHSRLAPDLPDAYVSTDPQRGDYGFILEETRNAVVENNIVEAMADGFGVVGRHPDVGGGAAVPGPSPIDGNRLLGNVALSCSNSGFSLESRCQAQAPCHDQARIVNDTELVDNVVIGGKSGVLSLGATNTRISQLTIIDTDVGVDLGWVEPNSGLGSSSSTRNALALRFRVAGFRADRQASWSFDHCAPIAGFGEPFRPADVNVVDPVTVEPALGACLILVPSASPLARAGVAGRPIGAQVIYRYENSLLTTERLWLRASDAFPCGAVIEGVNDDPGESCSGIHQRLHVGNAARCPLP
jgi:hypothetical protein